MLWFFVVRNHYDRDLLSLKCFGFNLFVMINVLKKLFSDTERFSFFFLVYSFLCIYVCMYADICVSVGVLVCLFSFVYRNFLLLFIRINWRLSLDQFFVTKPMFRRLGLPNNGFTVLNDLSLSFIIGFAIEMIYLKIRLQ